MTWMNHKLCSTCANAHAKWRFMLVAHKMTKKVPNIPAPTSFCHQILKLSTSKSHQHHFKERLSKNHYHFVRTNWFVTNRYFFYKHPNSTYHESLLQRSWILNRIFWSAFIGLTSMNKKGTWEEGRNRYWTWLDHVRFRSQPKKY